MKYGFYGFILLALLGPVPGGAAPDDPPADTKSKISAGMSSIGATVKRDAKVVADAAKDGAHKVAGAAKEVAHKVADASKQGAHEVAGAAKRGADKAKAAVKPDKADPHGGT
jgi:hypothetical protein